MDFNARFKVDSSELDKVTKQLKDIQKMTAGDFLQFNLDYSAKQAEEQLKDIQNTAASVENALIAAFNPRIGSTDITVFRDELNKAGLSLKEVYNSFSNVGPQGVAAFRSVANQITSFDNGLRTTQGLLSKMGQTLMNTIKWNISSSIVNQFTGSFQQAVGYVRHLDTALNDIRIVTSKSSEDMSAFADQANRAAQSLGKATADYAEAALIYAQQGLGDEEVEARTELTLKTASVTGQSTAEVSEQLTSVWNGYKIGAEGAEKAIDVLAAVAATTASDLEELSTGMSKVASAANTMGVSEEQLAAMLSTVISTTRQAPETVGVAFKTIFARISDIEQGLDDEFASLGLYSGKMASFGINVLDANSKLRDMGDILEEIGCKWEDMTREQQISLTQTMAGQRQYSNLIALFDNFDQYNKALTTASNSEGTLAQQSETYLESTTAHINAMGAAWENFYDSMLDAGTINTVADLLKTLGNLAAGFVDSIGGGIGVLTNFGAIATNVFSTQIGTGLAKAVAQIKEFKNSSQQIAAGEQFFSEQDLSEFDRYSDEIQKINRDVAKYKGLFSEEQKAELERQKLLTQQSVAQRDAYIELIAKAGELKTDSGRNEGLATQIREGTVDASELRDILAEVGQTLENAGEKARKLLSTKDKSSFAAELKKEFEDFQNWDTSQLPEADISDRYSSLIMKLSEMKSTAKEAFEGLDVLQDDVNSKMKEASKNFSEATESIDIWGATPEQMKAVKAALQEYYEAIISVTESTAEATDVQREQTAEMATNAANLANIINDEGNSFSRLQTYVEALADAKHYEQMAKIASSLMSLGAVFTNVTGLMNTWNGVAEGTVTVGEAVGKTISSLSTTALQMVSVLNTILPLVQSAGGWMGFLKAALVALNNPIGWVVMGIAAIGAALAAFNWLSQASQRELQRLAEQAEATAEAAEELNEAFKQFNETQSSYEEAIDGLEDLAEGTDEYREAIEEANEKAKELIETNKELAGSYHYENGLIVFDEGALEEANAKMAQQSANLNIASQAANVKYINAKAKSSTPDDNIVSLQQGLADYNKPVVTQEDFDEYLKVWAKNNALDYDQMQMGGNLPTFEEFNQALEENEASLKELNSATESLANAIVEGDSELQELPRTISDFAQSSLNAHLQTDEYAETLEKAEEKLNLEDSETIKRMYTDAFGGAYDSTTGKIKDVNGEELDVDEQVLRDRLAELQAVTDIYNQFSKALVEFAENAAVVEEMSGFEGIQEQLDTWLSDPSNFYLDLTQSEIDAVKQWLESAIQSGLIPQEVLDEMGYADGQEWLAAVYKGIEETVNSPGYKGSFLGAFEAEKSERDQLKSAEAMLKEKESFEDLSKEEGEQLQDLEEKYAQLAEARLFGIDVYKEKLIQLRDLEDQAVTEKAKRAWAVMDEQFDSIEVDIDLNTEDAVEKLDELYDQMWDFFDADWSLDASVITDIASDVEVLVDKMQDLADTAALVGEGYRVSADDLEAFTAMFPELVAQAYVANGILEDGALQLSQSLINTAYDTAEGEIKANSASVLERIHSERDILVAKQTAAKAALEAEKATLQALVEGTIDANEAKSQSEENLENYRTELRKITIENGATATKEELENFGTTNEAGTELYNDLTKQALTSFNQQSLSAGQFFKNLNMDISQASKNFAAMYAGEVVEAGDVFSKGVTAGGQTSGSSFGDKLGAFVNKVTSSATAALKQAPSSTNAMTDAATKAMQEQLEMNIIRLQNQINAYDGGLAELANLESQLKAARYQLDEAKSKMGQPEKTEKEKTTKEPTVKDPDYMDYLEDEADRYHDIDIEIQNIERDITRLQQKREKLIGSEVIDNLNEELTLIEKQIEAYKTKMAIAHVELSEKQNALKQQGVTFDADGQIANYTQAYQAALAKVNGAIAAYNGMTADEQSASGKAMVEAAQKEFEAFKDNISRYDELINDLIPDLQDTIQSAIDKQIEINVQKFKMEVEVRLDMAEAERSWNEFKKKVIDGIKDDDFLGIITSQYKDLLTYYDTAGTGKGPIQALTDQINATLDQLKSMDGTFGEWATAYGDNQAAALEDLKTFMDELMSQMMDVEDLINSIEDTYLNMIDSIKNAFDEQADNYKTIDELIEHNKNVIGLIYGDDAYEQMSHYYDKQAENNLQQLDFLKQEANFWKEKMDAEEKGSEAWKKYKENWEEAIGDLNSMVETSIQTLIDRYTNIIDDVFQKLNDKVSNGLGLNYIETEWDLINRNADEYLDTINRAYEMQQLQSKFQDALANNSGLKAQQQIKDLMDQQLGDLEQREKLTAYDVERAERLLEIELKKIALEDAQQNKSKMRLRRDAQGNYSYQFVSDEDQVRQAQQELAEAQNSLYNFDKDRYQSNLNDIYATYSEFQEKLKELYEDTALSDEERERQKTLLIQQYGELINAKTEQNAQIRLNLEQSAFNELAKMYGTSVEEFYAMTEAQRNALMEDLIPYWNSGIQEMVDTFAGNGGFIPTCADSFKELEEATKDYVNQLDEIQSAADINFSAIAEGYDKNIDLAGELIIKNDELLDQYDKELKAVLEVLDAVRALANEYANVKNQAIAASEAALKYQQEEAQRKAAAAEEERKKLEAANAASSSSSSSSSGGTAPAPSGNSSKTVSLSDVKIGSKFKYTGGWYYYDSNGTAPAGNRGAGGTVTVENVAPDNKYKVAVTSTNSAYGWLNVDQLEKMKTGGYTGDWGESGKLAILHQKELVLNADDTQNMLSAVAILRGLSDVLGAETLANLSNALDKIRVTPMTQDNKKSDDIIEQRVEINATFPNVRDSGEVEEAINNLINTAAQRRMRRGR